MKTTEDLVEKLMLQCGLGTVQPPVLPVSGGFLHRMYKVTTDSGIYAVKQLNAEIMSRPDARDNFLRAEKLECILEKNGIPIIPSLTVAGKKMQKADGCYFYIFNWVEGHITNWKDITNDKCYKAGNILGKIHAIEPGDREHLSPVFSHIDWCGYILRAKREKSELAELLTDNEALFLYAERELNKARSLLPDILCISDEDMDPKNVMWVGEDPWVIDLECLDYGNPVSSVLQLALQWAGTVVYDIDVGKLTAFFDGYLNAYDNHFRAYGDVFGVAYTWVEWLAYNIRRALGDCGDEEERKTGISEVRNTVRRIRYLYEMEKKIRTALDLRLRGI